MQQDSADVTIRIPEEAPYQVLPPLEDDEFSALEADILENGIQEDVIVDEDGIPIDGYTRAEIGIENDIEIPYTVREGLSEQEKRDLAYRLNLNRRHLERGKKKEIVEQYLLEDWDGDNSDGWYEEVSSKLGVGSTTVYEAFSELKEDGEFSASGIFSKDEEKKQVKDYIEKNPDASNREVTENIEAGVHHTTVGNWRNQWEEETEDDEETETQEETEEEVPTSFSDVTDEEVEDIEKPTEVVDDDEEEEESSPTPWQKQIEQIETREVEVEDIETLTLEIPEDLYERTEKYASDFDYESVEDYLRFLIPEYLESEDGTEEIVRLLQTKAAKRGY